MCAKVRLDTLLAARELFPSRTAAARAVRAGEVRLGIDGPKAIRPSEMVEADLSPVITGAARYVSRGGEKLAAALDHLGVDPDGRDCVDIGASTGGFTDCLLQRGAARVAAVDVGYGQLEDRLRRDPRVIELSRSNARELEPEQIPFVPSLAVIDVSFISLCKVLPAVAAILRDDGEVLAMVKPQFELGPRRVGRGGVVRDPELRREAVLRVADCAAPLGLGAQGFASSGLPGPKGNRETFIRFTVGTDPIEDREAALAEVEV